MCNLLPEKNIRENEGETRKAGRGGELAGRNSKLGNTHLSIRVFACFLLGGGCLQVSHRDVAFQYAGLVPDITTAHIDPSGRTDLLKILDRAKVLAGS